MTWDGEGVDPWLPERLTGEATIQQAERRLRDAWLSTAAAWLVQVRRAVLAPFRSFGGRPDPVAVRAFGRDWTRRIARLVRGPVKDIMARGYEQVLGPGYRWDTRPAAVSHLAEVHNRMVRTPDDVFSLIAAELARAAALGETPTQMADRVDHILDTEDVENWRRRANTVARTESSAALNAAKMDSHHAMADKLGGDWETIWIGTDDGRTRPSHRDSDGQRVPLGQPFIVGGFPLRFPSDPLGPPHETINCLPPWQRVSVRATAFVERRFDGVLIEVTTANGHHLAATPNHPVLTAAGWAPIVAVQPGHYVLSRSEPRSAASWGDPDVAESDPTAEEVAGAIKLAVGRREGVPATLVDLDGQVVDEQVDVVRADHPLAFGRRAEQLEQLSHLSVHRGQGEMGLPGQRPALAGLAHADRHSLGLGPRQEAHLRDDLVDGVSGDAEPVSHGLGRHIVEVHRPDLVVVEAASVGGASRLQPAIPQRLRDDPLGNAERPRDAGDGQELDFVHVDNRVGEVDTVGGLASAGTGYGWHLVSSRNERRYVGPVYDFETTPGLIDAGGVVSANCRCTTALVRPGETVDMSDRQMLPDAARQMGSAVVAGPVASLAERVDELLSPQYKRPTFDDATAALVMDAVSAAVASGVPAAALAPLETAVAGRNRLKVMRAVRVLSKGVGLVEVARAGMQVSFDPDRHEPVAGFAPRPGQLVSVLRQGHDLMTGGGRATRLGRAVVTSPRATTAAARPDVFHLPGRHDQSTHGRRRKAKPAAPPADAGGRAPTPADAGTAYTGRRARVAQLAATPPAGARRLSGGQSATTELRTYPEGQRTVRKVYGRRPGGRPRREVDAETLAPLVFDALGLDAAATHRVDASTVEQEHIDGAVGVEIVPWGQAAPPGIVDSDDGRLIGLGDFVMSHWDRNPGNWIRTDGARIVPLDNGDAFGDDPSSQGSDFSGHFAGPANDMTAADVAVIRDRLAALETEFSAHGRAGWHRRMMRRLDHVAKRAAGTRNRVAT